jgi:hypothetical protein
MNPRMLLFAALASLSTATAEEKTPPAPAPELDGQPVILNLGMVTVYPKGVTAPPLEHEGAMGGTRPFAIIKLDGKLVGEVYGSPLGGKAKDEADGMKASAGKNEPITLMKRETANRTGKPHEITTLRLDVKSPLGKPWILHSLYFPKDDRSVTFKLAVSEQDFARVLPYFEAMFFTEEFIKKVAKTPEAKAADEDKQSTPEPPGR